MSGVRACRISMPGEAMEARRIFGGNLPARLESARAVTGPENGQRRGGPIIPGRYRPDTAT